VAGLGAQLFMRTLSGAEALFERSRIAQPARAGLGGFFVGGIAIALPEVTGNSGYITGLSLSFGRGPRARGFITAGCPAP